MEARKLDSFYKKKDVEGFLDYLQIKNKSSTELIKVRGEIIEICLKTDKYIQTLGRILYNLDIKIREKQHKEAYIIQNLDQNFTQKIPKKINKSKKETEKNKKSKKIT